ncbi:MAG: hypothetical protein PSX81_09925 [bacterium]|nr:hypothetical protein [bacterium]
MMLICALNPAQAPQVKKGEHALHSFSLLVDSGASRDLEQASSSQQFAIESTKLVLAIGAQHGTKDSPITKNTMKIAKYFIMQR